MCSLGIKPTTFALLTQCSTTEPQEHSFTIKNLGVILDSKLSFENHISNVTKTAFFHLRNIAKLQNILTVSNAEELVHLHLLI